MIDLVSFYLLWPWIILFALTLAVIGAIVLDAMGKR
jgi:hypothetical protein